MKAARVLGIATVLCGLLVALVPTVILPVCQELLETKAGMFVPMRCHYTAQAEIAIGSLLVFTGALLFVFGQRFEVRGALGAVTVALGVVVILIPTVLVGTCRNPEMPCNVGTKPALILLGAATLLLGAGGVWEAWRSGGRRLEMA